jgi:enamine deaminase RidA (YjgF/YER057c/UK114 family)
MVLKVTVYLDNINDFAAFNRIYSSFFEDDPPSRAALQAGALPLGAKVMIEMIALRD